MRITLFKWSGLSAQRSFVGLGNYYRLFADNIFWLSLKNNMLIVALSIVLCLPMSLFLAYHLSKSGKIAKLYRAILPLPNMLGDVAIATLWLFVYFPTFGLLNNLLNSVGLGGYARPWLGQKATALVAVTVPLAWKWLGFYTLLLLGGILQIDKDIIEAAAIDGANEWKKFWNVVIPLIKQNLLVAIVFIIVFSFNAVVAFTRVMTQGGPDRATETIPSYIIQQIFDYSSFGYAASVGAVMLIIMLILAVMSLRYLT
ncbi:MAG: sugar ABC transporter permease [Candidatus Hadarchaeum sp.]|uniref:carbohydrate ABC transporter permease n=1 Tax=Candidatus Hadarchaeum sp. TaxID=2883567 RepID=UPI00318292DF